MVYFIRNILTGNIKIGHSDVPPSRLKAFKTGNDCELVFIGMIEGDKSDEARLHRRFADRRIKNVGREWFRGDPDIYDYIHRLLNPYPELLGKTIRRVYLAGKITGDLWRDSILGSSDLWAVKSEVAEWCVPDAVAAPGFTGKLDYVGPFWFDLGTGHGFNNYGDHAYGPAPECLETDRDSIRSRCLNSLISSDLVFAWIDSEDCFGTLAEIAIAYSQSKTRGRPIAIAIATPSRFNPDRMWFVAGMAHFLITDAESPKSAWDRLWSGEVDPVVRKVKSMPGETKDLSVYRPGVRVSHPEYGIGRVTGIVGEGSNRKACVSFVIAGAKTFILARSPLRVITEDNQ